MWFRKKNGVNEYRKKLADIENSKFLPLNLHFLKSIGYEVLEINNNYHIVDFASFDGIVLCNVAIFFSFEGQKGGFRREKCCHL